MPSGPRGAGVNGDDPTTSKRGHLPPTQHRYIPPPPAAPTAERKEIKQWTVRLSMALIEHIIAVAYARRIPPSQVLDEWCW